MLRRAALAALLLAGVAGGPTGLMGQDAKTAPARSPRSLKPPPQQAPLPPAQVPGPRVRPKPERIKDPQEAIFRIGEDVYRESDFLDFLPYMMPAGRVEQTKRDRRLLTEARRVYKEQMLLVAKARKDGVPDSPEFQQRLENVIDYLLVDGARKKLLTADDVHPTEEQLLAHYEQNAEGYRAGETATARHILASVSAPAKDADKGAKAKDKDGQDEAGALAKIEKARKELKSGKGWDQVAKKYSDDPGSKDKGGLYENFDPSGMVPEFAEAVRTQAIGVVGPPVKTQFGYHMILVEARTPARTQTFEEARDRVRSQVVSKALTDAWAAHFDSLRAELGYSEGDELAKELADARAKEQAEEQAKEQTKGKVIGTPTRPKGAK